jgi:putative ABC transport system permease protein
VNVAGIAVRSLRQRRLSTLLTALGVALGVALVLFVFHVRDSAKRSFDSAGRGYDVVIGGIRTSSITSVLSTVFLLDAPTDRIPKDAYDDVKKDPRVRYAIPYAIGDVFRGHRVIGTTPEFFEAIEDAEGRALSTHIQSGGRVFAGGDEFEAVLGATAAAASGLTLGATFTVSHGLEAGGHAHKEKWTVVGLLDPTGTPNDRAVFITLGSFFHVEGHEEHKKGEAPAMGEGGDAAPSMDADADHDHDHGDADHDHDADHEGTGVWAVSSIVVRLKVAPTRLQFIEDMNQRKDLRAAIPQREISRLFDIVANVDGLFRWVAVLVVLTAALMVLVGLYNTIQGRRREIAILRALGARPAHIFEVVVIEAVLTALLGGVLGLVLGHVGVAAAGPYLLETLGVLVGPEPGVLDLVVLGALTALGGLAGVLPAWRALSTPVAENLHPID